MKYIVRFLTTLLYLLAGAAIVYGLSRFVRAGMPAPAGGNPYEGSLFDAYSYGYVSSLIASGIRWVAFGGVLGWWASTWRSRSVALHGRSPSIRLLGSGAWGFLALFGFSVAAARDIADTAEGFCSNRRGMLLGSLDNYITGHELRLPRDWIRAFREDFDEGGVLSGSPACLEASRLDELLWSCSGGFHITTDIDIGSPVCDLSSESRYKVDIEFLTDHQKQTVNVRFLDEP